MHSGFLFECFDGTGPQLSNLVNRFVSGKARSDEVAGDQCSGSSQTGTTVNEGGQILLHGDIGCVKKEINCLEARWFHVGYGKMNPSQTCLLQRLWIQRRFSERHDQADTLTTDDLQICF